MIERTNAPSAACAAFVEGLRPADLPKAAREQLKACLLDWLGCAIRGAVQPQSLLVRRVVDSLGGAPQARRIGTFCAAEDRTSLVNAALCNGAYGHLLEMDDVDRDAISHPATVVFPAALSVGEHVEASGMAMLTAVAAGYEVMLRIGAAVTPEHYAIWHTTATTGGFGAAMTAGHLLGLGRPQLDWALGNAGTLAAGLWQFLPDRAMSKILHTGAAAANGVLVALLAREGFTGATHILEGSQGFFAGYARQETDATLFRDFGVRYRSERVSLKPYPCCRHTHAAIDAVLRLREQAQDDQLASLHITTYGTALRVAGTPNPVTPGEGRFSLAYCAASAAVRGTVEETDFLPERIIDPAVQNLMKHITVQADPLLDSCVPLTWPCIATAVTRSGRTLKTRVDNAKGDPENPLSWEEVAHKFRLMVRGVLTPAGTETLVSQCARLEELPRCAALLRTVNGAFIKA